MWQERHEEISEETGAVTVVETLDIVFMRTWWRYTPEDGQWFTVIYHWFNIAEGGAWVVCSCLVFRRFVKHRNSRSEVFYAIAFLAFAVTDFREAWEQSSWLIWLKLANLIVLFQLRRTIMSRYYPAAKLY
ncbi:MAG: hypothetical protein HQ518_14660 [Rhodopirellula sp.]|nr:hypothetical protein [Rhodopirellula sp.]